MAKVSKFVELKFIVSKLHSLAIHPQISIEKAGLSDSVGRKSGANKSTYELNLPQL